MTEIWSNRPTNGELTAKFRLIRTPAKGSLQGVILSSENVGCYTHYWRGRTTPCRGEDCEPCGKGHAARWYGYIGLWSPKSNNVAIFEFTPAALDAVDTYFTVHGTLRGAELTAQRIGTRANARVQLVLKEASWASGKMPVEPDVRATLELIWEVRKDFKLDMKGNSHDETLIANANREKILAAAEAEQNGQSRRKR